MNKKVGAVIVILLLLVGMEALTFFMLPALIDTASVKNEIITSFKAVTGLDLEIQGNVNIQSFPLPHITINSMDVLNAPGGNASFLLTIRSIEIWPSVPSLLHGRMRINKMIIDGVDVELERLKDNKINWQYLTSAAPASGKTSAPPPAQPIEIADITISDAMINYVNTPAEKTYEWADIALTLIHSSSQNRNKINASLRYADKPFQLTGTIGDLYQAMSTGLLPINLNLRNNKTQFTYDGTVGIKNKQLYLDGKTMFESDNIVPWLSLGLGDTSKPAANSNYTALPLQEKNDISTDGNKITFSNIALSGPIIKGNSTIALQNFNHVDITAAIDTLDLEAVAASGISNIQTSEAGKEDISGTSFMSSKSALRDYTMNGNLKFVDILYNHQHIKDAHADFDMAQGVMTIPQASAALPGDSRIVFSGLGKESFEGFSLEGEIDARGENFCQMVTVFKPKGFSLPAEDFKRFVLKTNAVISTKEARFSEMAMRIENVGLQGGIITTFGDRTKIEAALHIGGVNLDHFFALWGFQEWRASFFDVTPGPKTESLISQWLKQLGYDMKLNIYLEQFILDGALRDRSEFQLEATTGKISLKNLKTTYNGTALDGDVALNVLGEVPKIDLTVSADTLDVKQFFSANGKVPQMIAQATTKPTGERWSHQQYDLYWMQLLDANFRMHFDHFKYDTFQADTVDVKGSILEHNLNIEGLSMAAFGARMAGRGTLTGGKIPAVNMAANVLGLDIEQLATIFPLLQGMTGKYNLSVRLNTNGIDEATMISNLDGTVGIGGNNVMVKGFNMPSIVHAVSYVRTVADIYDVVKRAFPGGDTIFTKIEGQWVATAGMFQASNMKLATDDSDGSMVGTVDLLNWKTDSSITFSLKTLDPRDPPHMTIGFTGSLDGAEKQLNTRSLEQYVTRQTSQKMLNQYGTQ